MIEGLKLTLTGEELRTLLEQRMEDLRRHADHWKRELAKAPEEATDEDPLLPDNMCENEAERYEWRIEVLEFIRDHIDVSEVYRLGEADLAFGELLPEKPSWLEQEEYEERTSVGFHLGRLVKRMDGYTPWEYARLERLASERNFERDQEITGESHGESEDEGSIEVESDAASGEAVSRG